MGGWSGGVYSRFRNWVTDKANSINPQASLFDQEDDGFAAGLNNCVTKDGLNKPSSAMDWNGQNLTGVLNFSNTGTISLTGGKMTVSATGLTTVGAPSSGPAFNVNGAAGNGLGTFANANATGFANMVFQNDAGKQLSIGVGGSTAGGPSQNQPQVSTLTNDSLLLATNGVGRMIIAASDVNAAQLHDDGGTFQVLGWRDCPQNAQAANYTMVLADRGKMLYPTVGGITFTIPANSVTAFPAGTTIVVVNEAGSNISIAINTDTLTLAGTTTTGTRTLGNHGMATIIKLSTTSWLVSGAGVS